MVTAGKPSELGFKLSKSSALPWKGTAPTDTISFNVTNKGALPHDFKICTKSITGSTVLSCSGTVTKMLKPGQSAVLTVTFKKRGAYEYLCTVPGHAASGMKGLIGVGVNLASSPKPPPTSTPTTTAPATTTTPTGSVGTPVGNAANGAAVFQSAGCASCHTLAAAGSTGSVGPNLDTLKPVAGLVNATVTSGFGEMPSFAGTLSAQQIADVSAYVAASTGAH